MPIFQMREHELTARQTFGPVRTLAPEQQGRSPAQKRPLPATAKPRYVREQFSKRSALIWISAHLFFPR